MIKHLEKEGMYQSTVESRWWNKLWCQDVKVFEDPWIPRPCLFIPITRPRKVDISLHVANLID